MALNVLLMCLGHWSVLQGGCLAFPCIAVFVVLASLSGVLVGYTGVFIKEKLRN